MDLFHQFCLRIAVDTSTASHYNSSVVCPPPTFYEFSSPTRGIISVPVRLGCVMSNVLPPIKIVRASIYLREATGVHTIEGHLYGRVGSALSRLSPSLSPSLSPPRSLCLVESHRFVAGIHFDDTDRTCRGHEATPLSAMSMSFTPFIAKAHPS